MSADGRTQAVTWRRSGGANQRVQVASSSDYGVTWSTPQTLSDAGQNAVYPEVAMSADGTTQTVTWERYDGSSYRVQVSVADSSTVPSAPGSLVAVGGDGEVVVSWSAPVDDGGRPVGYTVTAFLGDLVSGSCESSSTSCVVSGLTNGVQYSFTVVASNVNGDGVASGVVSATPSKVLSVADIGVDCSTPQPHPFVDVAESSFAYDSIGCIYALGVTTGTSSETYSPAGLVTREQMGAFLGRFFETVTGTDCGGAHPFVDVAESSFAFDDIGCIYALGVTTGTSSTSYSPAGLVTREQMAAFLERMYEALTNVECGGEHPFVDVAESSFAYDSIGCIYGLGVTTGTSSETYSPKSSVTREQMAAFLERLYNTVTS